MVTMTDLNLHVNIGRGLILENPVITASGTFGYGTEFEDFVNLDGLGAIIVKGTTLNPREGNPYPRMAETPSGMLNAVGLQNKGVDYFIDKIYPRIEKYKCKIIVNVSGASPEDYSEVCRRLSSCDRVDAVEVNISCPNVRQGGMAFGTSCEGATIITEAVRKVWDKCMIVKLSPNVTDITEIAKAAEGAGADSVSLVNTFLGMSIDIEKRKPHLSTITGGLSGPCIRPIALRMVWQVAKVVKIPVIGLGGIMDASDALQFIMAGASAIEIGTANFVNPRVSEDVVNGLKSYCDRHKVKDLSLLRGII